MFFSKGEYFLERRSSVTLEGFKVPKLLIISTNVETHYPTGVDSIERGEICVILELTLPNDRMSYETE